MRSRARAQISRLPEPLSSGLGRGNDFTEADVEALQGVRNSLADAKIIALLVVSDAAGALEFKPQIRRPNYLRQLFGRAGENQFNQHMATPENNAGAAKGALGLGVLRARQFAQNRILNLQSSRDKGLRNFWQSLDRNLSRIDIRRR